LRGIPECFVAVLSNWYSKLSSVVRWQNNLSSTFAVKSGVRQGGILSPILFNVYTDELSVWLQECGHGCVINKQFVGCVMYADDVLLISASIGGLQKLLDVCHKYCEVVGLVLNAKKSNCVMIGKFNNTNISNMEIGGIPIVWSKTLKYLGVYFIAGNALKVDCSEIRKKIYAVCNGILFKCKGAPENVKLFMIKTYCFPLLMYCICALRLNQTEIAEIGVCLNDAFRKIYGVHRWESVAPILYFTNTLPFKFMYHLAFWNFICDVRAAETYTVPTMVKFIFDIRQAELNYCEPFEDIYDFHGLSKLGRKSAILDYFGKSLSL
jgi:hypothetical protein